MVRDGQVRKENGGACQLLDGLALPHLLMPASSCTPCFPLPAATAPLQKAR